MTDRGASPEGTDRIAVAGGYCAATAHGAQLLNWRDAEFGDVIFLSPGADFSAGAAIRGGIPICFPWFAAGPDGDAKPSHGFARTARWRRIGSVDLDDGNDTASVQYEMTGDDVHGADGRDRWPYAFRATYAISASPRELTAALTVENTDQRGFEYEAALHTYLRCGDVRQVAVRGLENVAYFDKVASTERDGDPHSLRFDGETDRIYRTAGETLLIDPVLGRRLRMTPDGATATVVWNPGARKAAEMSDLGPDQWPFMVCVESACIAPNGVRLEPGEQHTMRVRYEVERG